MATAPTSTSASMIFTQSESTGAQRTWVFHLVKSADSTDATGLAPAMTISKAGSSFVAPNAGTAISELTNGWYKVVHDPADLDTIGALAVRITAATADPLNIVHQVTVFDLNNAVVSLPSGSIQASTFSSDALTAISSPLRASRKLATLTASGSVAVSMLDAQDVLVEVTGTFGGGSAQVQTTEDPTAATPVWTNRGSALTANGQVSVVGPHNAVRINLTGATNPNLAAVFTIRKPSALN